MPLKIVLGPGEIVVVNGCVLRNVDRRQAFWIDTRADVLRGKDVMDPETATTPVRRAYALAQVALLRPERRDAVLPVLQETLADLAAAFAPERAARVHDAAHAVSSGNPYGALSILRRLIPEEDALLADAAR